MKSESGGFLILKLPFYPRDGSQPFMIKFNQITNFMMNGLPGLAIGANGKLYGIAGRPPGYAHLFSYEPNGEGFRYYGNPRFPMVAPGIEQGIKWRANNIGALTSSKDGRIYCDGRRRSVKSAPDIYC